MKIVIKKIEKIIVTYAPGEKIKAINYCLHEGYDISNTLDEGVVIAEKEIKEE